MKRVPREIKINKKNLSLERRYEIREMRMNKAPMIAFIIELVLATTEIILVCNLVLGIVTKVLGVLCGVGLLGFFITGMVCIEIQMDYEEWKNKYIKRRINKRWRKHKRWLI